MIGRVLNGRYRVTERVGVGGMAEVYRATDTVLGRTVAVKVMLSRYAADEEFAERFRQEAASAANLNSPYIVNIYDWGTDDDTPFIVMEYVRGADLKSGIKQRGRINPRKAADIGVQVCQALTCAHKQDIIHRDIKPQNIMIQPDGNIKVMDFGIARSKNSVKTETGSVLGTAHYISPEQAQGKGLAGTSDLYSLGVVLYECVTGQVPFDAPDAVSVAVMQVKEEPIPPTDLNPDLDPGLEAIILRAMQKDPCARYRSAAEMKEALQAWLAGTPIDADGNPVAADAAATVVMGSAAAAAAAAGDEGAFAPDVTAYYPGANARHGTLATRPATGAAITESQAAARARIAARDHQAATGGTFLPPEDSGTVRRVRAHDAAYDGPRRGKAGVIAAIVILVLAAIVAALFMLNKCSGDITGDVPNLVGKSQTEAARVIKSAGFVVGEVTKEYSDTVEAGRVISQSPAAGTELEPGATITMVVSKGKELVTVPVITGKTVTEVQQILEEAGLVPKAGEASYDAIVEINKVKSQDPVPGTKVEKGSTVMYVLSLGPENINVPNVVGSTLSKARSILTGAGFQVFEEHEYSATVDKDVVIRQSPGANSKLEKGSSVTIIVSDGVEMVTIPSVTGLTMKEATSKLLAAGLNVDKVGGTGDDAICIKQTPAASSGKDDTVPRGTMVTIQGQEWIEVPDIVGVPEANALSALQALGLSGRNDGSQYHDSIPAGCVIIQDPVAGSKIDKRGVTDPSSGISTVVGYVISLGPEPAPEPPPTPPEPGGDEPGGDEPGGGSGEGGGGSGEGGGGSGEGGSGEGGEGGSGE